MFFLARKIAGKRVFQQLKTRFPAIFSIFSDIFSTFFQHFCGWKVFQHLFFHHFFAAEIRKIVSRNFRPKLVWKIAGKHYFLQFSGVLQQFSMDFQLKNQYFSPAICSSAPRTETTVRTIRDILSLDILSRKPRWGRMRSVWEANMMKIAERRIWWK